MTDLSFWKDNYYLKCTLERFNVLCFIRYLFLSGRCHPKLTIKDTSPVLSTSGFWFAPRSIPTWSLFLTRSGRHQDVFVRDEAQIIISCMSPTPQYSSIMMRSVHDRARVQGMLWMIAGWSVALFISGLFYRRKAQAGETMDAILHQRQMAYNKRKEAELKLEAAFKGNK